MRLQIIVLGLSLLSSSYAWDSDLFPAVYEAVLTHNQALIDATSAIKTGIENIQNAVVVDLNQTVTCLDGLDEVQGSECFDLASNYVLNSAKEVKPFIEQRFRNMFIPGYAKRTFGMMLFDASFLYWTDIGFHERNTEVILECVKKNCALQSAEIAAELLSVSANFSIVPGTITPQMVGPKLAGRFYEIDWKPMIDIYNLQLLTDTPLDNYNMWMPGALTSIIAEWPAAQTFHVYNYNTSSMALTDDESKSWFTAAKFSALHHFHYYYLFGPDRIFATAASNKPLDEFLELAEGMLTEDFVETLDKQDEFLDLVSTRFNRGEKMTTMAHFQVRLHHAGKLYMLHRNNAYKTFIESLAQPDKYWGVFKQQGGLTKLGYEQTDARLDDMGIFVKCITAIRWDLRIRQWQYDDVILKIVTLVVVPGCLLAILLLFFMCKLLQCCCKTFRYCMGCMKCMQERHCFCLCKKARTRPITADEDDDEEDDEEESYEDTEEEEPVKPTKSKSAVSQAKSKASMAKSKASQSKA